jgi:hypothetical protein
MKAVFFVGPISEYTNPLMEHLKKMGFLCLKSSTPDEIDQSGQQSGKSILIFNDLKFAYKFISENSWSGFEEKYVLYLDKNYQIPKETLDKINGLRIKIEYVSQGKNLLTDINNFMDSKSGGSDDSEGLDLEFGVNTK